MVRVLESNELVPNKNFSFFEDHLPNLTANVVGNHQTTILVVTGNMPNRILVVVVNLKRFEEELSRRLVLG